MKIGDQVRINPNGRYPNQSHDRIGVIIERTDHGGPHSIMVDWAAVEGGVPERNVYGKRDLLLFYNFERIFNKILTM